MSHAKEIRVTLEGDDLTLVEAASGVSASEFVNRAVQAALDELRPEESDEEGEDAAEDEPEEEAAEDEAPNKSGKQEAGDSKPADSAPGKKPAES